MPGGAAKDGMFIQRTTTREAEVLEAGEGETIYAVRRRLTAAAESAGDETGDLPFRQRRLLLDAGGPARVRLRKNPAG